jgi:nicotinate (nicotinamide) nucleotide adenylyltransferase
MNPATATTAASAPYTVGVFGGSFNPIHLGHALLAITVRQTKPVDEVVLVPVYRHAVKRDLLPFADRVRMCQLALHGDAQITVSTIEEQVGESNGAMLRALKLQYPPHTRFWWICGDDFVRMHRPKGLETLREVSGLMIQRRLHRSSHDSSGDNADSSANTFFQEPVDEQKIRRTLLTLEQLNDHPMEIDFVYGELPHFSSTLVRRAPGHWRSFLTSAVVRYLDERPQLVQQLLDNLQADAAREEQQQQQQLQQSSSCVNDTTTTTTATTMTMPPSARPSSTNHPQLWNRATATILQGLQVVHALQLERGHASLRLSLGHVTAWHEAQATTDALLSRQEEDAVPAVVSAADVLVESPADENDYDENTKRNWPELQALAAELRCIPDWLQPDRAVVEQRGPELTTRPGTDGWMARLGLVEKFNPRIDVLMAATVRAFSELLEHAKNHRSSNNPNNNNNNKNHWPLMELLYKWCEGKEALGRLRSLVAAGGPTVATLVRNSVTLRERLVTSIDTKERNLARVWQLETQTRTQAPAAPAALHKMLEQVTWMEYQLMGCFATSTPLPLVHRLLEEHALKKSSTTSSTTTPLTGKEDAGFDVVQFFDSCTSAIDFLLTFSMALAASACASA